MYEKYTKRFEMGKSNPKGAKSIEMHDIVKMSEWSKHTSMYQNKKNGAKRLHNPFRSNIPMYSKMLQNSPKHIVIFKNVIHCTLTNFSKTLQRLQSMGNIW